MHVYMYIYNLMCSVVVIWYSISKYMLMNEAVQIYNWCFRDWVMILTITMHVRSWIRSTMILFQLLINGTNCWLQIQQKISQKYAT